MNFIITFFLFAFLSVVGFISQWLIKDHSLNASLWFAALGIISTIVSLVLFVLFFTRNMYFRQRQSELINRLIRQKKLIVGEQDIYDNYVNKFSDDIMKLYPEYEKEIFKNVNPEDIEQIGVFLTKYPNLKFNGVLEKHIETTRSLYANIFARKKDVIETAEEIRNLQENDWFLLKKEIPEQYKDVGGNIKRTRTFRKKES